MRIACGTILALLSLTAVVRADIDAICTGNESSHLSSQEMVADLSQLQLNPEAKDWTSLVGSPSGVYTGGSFALQGRRQVMSDAGSSAQDSVRELPPDSGGASLLLLGLGTLGLLRAGRLAKQIHVADVSDWVHTGGPWQIGNSVIVELSFDRIDLPLCVFTQPNEGRCRTYHGTAHEVFLLLIPQWSVRSLPARAPPLV